MTSKTESDCIQPAAIDYKQHWDAAYEKTATTNLGWYEENAPESLQLIEELQLPKTATILNVGAGSTKLIDNLIALQYTNIIASDISTAALKNLQTRLGKDSENVTFIVDDLTNSQKINQLKNIDVWNDRAVLHFFLSEKDRNAYVDLLKKVVKINGHVIIAAFALNGAKKCCGLDVFRYDVEMLQELLGSDFQLQKSFDHTFTNPNGDPRPYVYTVFKRIKL